MAARTGTEASPESPAAGRCPFGHDVETAPGMVFHPDATAGPAAVGNPTDAESGRTNGHAHNEISSYSKVHSALLTGSDTHGNPTPAIPTNTYANTTHTTGSAASGYPYEIPPGSSFGHTADSTNDLPIGHPGGPDVHQPGSAGRGPENYPYNLEGTNPHSHTTGTAQQGYHDTAAKSGQHGHLAGLPHTDPSVMHERFGKMPLTDPDFFTVKRLESRSSPTASPSPLIRTGVHCFVFVECGETLVTIGTETYFFKANECAVIPAGQVFSVRYWHECIGFMGGFHTDFLGADCSGRSLMRAFPFLRKWGDHKVRFDSGQAPFVLNILHRLLGECDGGGNGDVLRTYLTALLVEIKQARAKDGEEPNIDNRLCNRFVEYVFENPSECHSLGFHAERLNISLPHLTRTVKKLTGKTPLQWINEAVVLEAKVLLSHTDLPVSEIAERVGHSDPSYFTRMFRRHVGMVPLAYRARSKNPKS